MTDRPVSAEKDTARLEWLVVGTGKKKAAHIMGSERTGKWSVCDCSNGLEFMSRGLPTSEKNTVVRAECPWCATRYTLLPNGLLPYHSFAGQFCYGSRKAP